MNARVVIPVDDPDYLAEVIGKEQRLKHHWFRLQGDVHGKADFALYEKIEEKLVPLLGESGVAPGRWFHETDYYGWGVRHLEFMPDTFDPDFIWLLQPLLKGQFRWFGIICWAELGPRKKTEGALIFANKVYATRNLAERAAVVQQGAPGDGFAAPEL